MEDMPDLTPVRSLDGLYVLPDRVTSDPTLRSLYEVLIQRYMEESAHLVLPIRAHLLIERIVLYYIVTREKERTGEGWGGHLAEKAFKQTWMQLVQELNKLIAGADVNSHRQMLQSVTTIILSVLGTVQDEQLRTKLTLQIASAIEEAQI